MKKWDIVLLSYPHTDLQAAQVRPALVISPDALHEKGPDAVFIYLTSNILRQAIYDLTIKEEHPEFKRTGLRKSSALRVSKIFTLEKSLVQSTIGSFGPALQADAERFIREFFELTPYQPPLEKT